VIVWDKMHLGMGHYFRRRHEQIVFASKGRRKVARRDLPDVWEVPRIHRAAYPTQKPVRLFEMMLEASAEPGFVVCDPFCGSGSSAVAAVRHGCDFIGADRNGARIARNENTKAHRCASATSASMRASSSRPTRRPSSIADGAVAHRPRQ